MSRIGYLSDGATASKVGIMKSPFETEIVFPSDPFEAAIIYFAVMAYPEEGAGQLGQHGSHFADSLVKLTLWSARRGRGLAWLRAQKGVSDCVAPKKREFRGTFERGMRRINRRIAAYELLGTQLVRTFFAASRLGAQAMRDGVPERAYHMNPNGGPSPMREELWSKAAPTPRQLIVGSEPHWSERFGIHETGPAADITQKSRDVYRRGFIPSLPVLHLVHGLNLSMEKHGSAIDGWKDREPLTAMLLNFPLWIDEAIGCAEEWRTTSKFLGAFNLAPDKMIRLVRQD